MSFTYDLPTTGSTTFSDFLTDPSGSHATRLSDASTARGRVRAVLKECRRTDDSQKDWPAAVKAVEDYLPHLLGILSAVENDRLLLKHEPAFSWRSTLSSYKLRSAPRVSLPTLHYELACCLMTLALSLSNTATATMTSLGAYERSRETSDRERKVADEKLNLAAQTLCRASGVFGYLSNTTIPNWEAGVGQAAVKGRPPELTREATAGLAKLAMADAERLAIRKLLSRAIMDTITTPGPPLPRSHPSPSLLAKMYINVHSLYASSRSLLKSVGEGAEPGVGGSLRKYLTDGTMFSEGVAFKWLGVDAGESSNQVGTAIGWLDMARARLVELGGKSSTIGKGAKERTRRKGVLEEELESVDSFLKSYNQLNRTVSFEPVPPLSALQARIPTGRPALSVIPYSLPEPAFNVSEGLDSLRIS